MFKGPLKLLALLALAVGATFAVPAIASATPPPADCKSVTVHLADRPDSGNHGTWATDQVDRTVKVCHVIPAKEVASETSSWHYTATAVDDGTFAAIVGAHNSPNAGSAITHATPGYMGGGFTATFTAPAHWGGWRGSYWSGKTLTGAAGTAANPTTSDFVKSLWEHGFDGSSIDNSWSWTYWTCSKTVKDALETWTDNYKTDGSGPDDGDITGKPCPSPSPSPSVSPTKGGATPTPSTTAGGALPVTGAKEDLIAAGGVVLLGAGVGALVYGRRKRTRFEA